MPQTVIPYRGVNAMPGAPSTAEAAQILKRALESGFNPRKARMLQEQQQSDMAHNIDLESESNANQVSAQRARAFQSPSERRRDEMMGWSGPSRSFSGATPSDVRNLQNDLDEDPTFGVAARARTARVDDTLSDAATMQRDEVDQASQTGARRNAFAEFVKNQAAVSGKLAGEVDPTSVEALDNASGRRQLELGVRAQGNHGIYGGAVPPLRLGDDPLSGLSPQRAEIVKSLTKYELPTTGSQLRTPEWQDLVARAKLIDPTFDASLYESRQKMRSDPKFRENIQSLGTAQQHLTEFESASKKLNNWDSKPVNKFKNWWLDINGDPDVQSFGVTQNTSATEIPRALKGDSPTIPDIEAWKAVFGRDKSPAGQAATMASTRDVLKARIEEARHSYDARMGKPGAFDDYMRSVDTNQPPGGSPDASGDISYDRVNGKLVPRVRR